MVISEHFTVWLYFHDEQLSQTRYDKLSKSRQLKVKTRNKERTASLTDQPTNQPKELTKGGVLRRRTTSSLARLNHSCVRNAQLDLKRNRRYNKWGYAYANGFSLSETVAVSLSSLHQMLNYCLFPICRFTDEVGNMQRLLKPILQLYLRRPPLGSPNLPEAIATLLRQLSCRIFHSQDHVLWCRSVWLWPPASLC
jgi:hypothetical protein